MRNIFFFTIFLIALASCKEAKQVIYLKDAETLPIELLQKKSEPAGSDFFCNNSIGKVSASFK